MQLLMLLLGTALSALFVILLLTGKKYDSLTDGLNNNDYPFNSIYCVGFSLNNWKLFSMRGKIRSKLISQAVLLYDPRYAEYYATLVWAQVLSFVFFFLAFGLLLAGALDFGFFAIVAVVAAGLFGYYFFKKMGDQIAKRQDECVTELPEVVSSMALLINSGMVLRDAWEIIAYSKTGTVYDLMQDACVQMQNGVSDVDAIQRFGTLSASAEVKKFSGALIQGLQKGSRELSDFLVQQSTEMWEGKKQRTLQKGEAAASKLLMPTVLIFGGIILTVLAAAFSMLM